MLSEDYRQKNQKLLDFCLQEIEALTADAQILILLEKALRKSIKVQSTRPAPPLYAWLTAEDLGQQEQSWAWPLSAACAYFYATADLFDDIQDQDDQQPVLKAVGPAQALNIANLLLMACHKTLAALALPAQNRLNLLELFSLTGQLMSIGQFYDLHSTNLQGLNYPPEMIFPKKAGAELACFLMAVPMALGEIQQLPLDLDTNAGLYGALGQEIGSLLQIFTDYFDIWVPQADHKLSQDLAVHKNSFPLYWARADHNWGKLVESELAGRSNQARRQFQLRRLLAQTQAPEKFEAYLISARTRVEPIFHHLPNLPQLQALWQEDCELASQLIQSLYELRAKTQGKLASFQRQLAPEAALAAALDYLQAVPDYRDVWEVQRWGFLGQSVVQGNLFNPLLILEALATAGQNIEAELLRILERRLSDGWHYYSDCAQIPPDTDDLGQILNLLGLCRNHSLDAQLAEPLKLLYKNIDALGYCPTWLCDEERYKRSEVDKTWFGNLCPGVMANLYYGLAQYDQQAHRQLLNKGAQELISRFDPDALRWPTTHYPDDIYVAYLIARLCQRLELEADCLQLVEHRILVEQALDGSWKQQAQRSAFALLFLSLRPESPELKQACRRGLNYLLDVQEYDGSWPAAGLFVRPGRELAFELFAHPKLTTAFVVRALISVHPLVVTETSPEVVLQ